MGRGDEDVSVRVQDVPERMRFEVVVDGELAGYAEYLRSGGLVVFHHTVVDDAFGGQGIGSRLVRGAIDDVRRRQLSIVARCPYVRGWLERHPEYRDLVRPDPGG